jgi:hypothetical protein
MGKKSRRVDEPTLDTMWDCHNEISRCSIEIGKVEREYAEWKANNPGGSWPGATLGIRKWEARKARAEARFDELDKTRP